MAIPFKKIDLIKWIKWYGCITFLGKREWINIWNRYYHSDLLKLKDQLFKYIALGSNISITNDYKTLIDIAEQKGPKNSLVVIGISAWNIGQLDGEIEKGHWNLSEVKDEIIFKKNNKDKFILATENSFIRLWKKLLNILYTS